MTRALIVGGGTGLGLGSAVALAAAGGRVFLTGRRAGPLDEAAATLGSACAGTMTGDATNEEDVAKVVDAAAAALGGIDTLVVSSGITAVGSVVDAKLADVRRVLDTNILPSFLFTRAVVPHMTDGGAVILVASIAGTVPHAERVAYGSSKAAVIGMAKQMALDLAPRRIRVNAVSPSLVLTDMSRGAIAASADPERTLTEREGRHPIGRLGTAEDVGAMVAYLAGPNGGWITGQDLQLDGGLSLRAAASPPG
ncbi:SDR family NAD(P)-dependent oxidoreductase [Acuticoccus yangtzensis]|uniref:SDR family NAD(P)-dependent oxidoreductase n=1 Tax=Acuticoccus yangtzensis TaxID=1443441 RepID=UPI0009499E62|nr:SDR family oxidoreductase [Acuticoccus yangtzensis]